MKNTFYATLGEYQYSDEYSQVDEICIYVAFMVMLINKGISFDFLQEKLKQIVTSNLLDSYKADLENEFDDFISDVNLIKQTL